MTPFTVSVGKMTETFWPIRDFAEGHDHFHWTLDGIEKLIRIGLWRRDYDLRGKLKSKPPRVEAVIEAVNRRPRRVPSIPPLSQGVR
jgi:hypothetical protein